jgi:hypothetical protein
MPITGKTTFNSVTRRLWRSAAVCTLASAAGRAAITAPGEDAADCSIISFCRKGYPPSRDPRAKAVVHVQEPDRLLVIPHNE